MRNETEGRFLQTFDYDLLTETADEYHHVVLDKPGTPFYDSLVIEDDDFSSALWRYTPSKVYHEKLSLEWRVGAVSKALDFLIEQGYYDNSKIVAWGFSERYGSDVCRSHLPAMGKFWLSGDFRKSAKADGS